MTLKNWKVKSDAKIFILLFLMSCTVHREPGNLVISTIAVESTDTSLHFINGYLYRGARLFSGIINEHYKNDTLYHSTSYVAGKEEGWMYTYFPEGNISEKRYYHHGEKDSVHMGWWPNRKPRFEYHFTSGLYNGDFKEWYSEGENYKHLHYINGKEDWGKGWRQNGKVYMNFIVKNGRRYGLENSNLCYTVKNEKGEYVNAELPRSGR